MNNRTNTDNIFAIGTVITAKENPDLKLTIVKYYKRIYFCASVANPSLKHLAYFENELNPQ